MDNRNMEVEYLNQIIKLQNDLIGFLKTEVERLKVTPIYYPPNLNPSPIIGPSSPNNPFIHPYNQPLYPGVNPFVITYEDVSTGGRATGST